MRTVIIGTGNVAVVLGKKIKLAGHEIVQIAGRNAMAAERLAGILGCGYTTDFGQINPEADLYIIAVTDDAIAGVAAALKAGRKLVVHTAGSVSKEVLKIASINYGVLYPLQSLRKEMQELPEIPLLVDGNTPDNLALIAEFAHTLSLQVTVAGDAQRMKLHLAAVMVSNFTNHLYAMAESYCVAEQADFRLLLPLISAIAQRVHYFSPSEVQTGPAIRHDTKTIKKHLELLSDHPELKELYAMFTTSIQQWRQLNNEGGGV